MSGTSLDGVDAVLVDFSQPKPSISCNYFLPYPQQLKQDILRLQHPAENELEHQALIANQLAELYAQTVQALLQKSGNTASDIRAIGCHGQTIRHRPELGFTMQIGNNALLAELTDISVVGDFRSRDVAAGGHGAPLVPAFHQAIFAHPQKNRVIVNIGGIANITYLGKDGQVFGFDSGPGNMLLDHWIKLRLDKDYDEDGAWAATGIVHTLFLQNMLAEPYFSLPPPKSTGRDLFNDIWLQSHILYPHCRPQDIARTLVALTAHSIVLAIQKTCDEVDEIYICGGGAHNRLLMADLQELLSNIPIATTNQLGVDVDWVEAVAFAWLAKQTLDGNSGNLPEVTGAKGKRILGSIYPH